MRLKILQLLHDIRSALEHRLGQLFVVRRIALGEFGERHDDGQRVVDVVLHLTELFDASPGALRGSFQKGLVGHCNYLWRRGAGCALLGGLNLRRKCQQK